MAVAEDSVIDWKAPGSCMFMFFFQAEDGIRDLVRSRGLRDVYKRQRRDSPSASVRPVTDSHCRQETGRGNDVSITSTVRYIMPTRRRRSAIMRPLDRLALASPLNDRPKLKIATAINHFDQFPTGVLVRSIARRRPRLMARRSGKASKSTRRVNVH